MTNDTTTAPGGAMPNGADPQGVTPNTSATSETLETTTPQSPDAVQKELADLKSALKKANDEAKTHRLKANELDKLKADLEASKLSETERLQKQYDDLKAQHDAYTQEQVERTISYEVSLQAASLGVNPKHLDRVARLIDWEELDFDEKTGGVTNIRSVLEALIKDMPELLSKGVPAPTSGGATNPSRSTTTAPPAITEDYLAKLTSAEYAAMTPERRQEITRWRLANPPGYGQRRH
jgi:phage-related minor tail protein